MDGQGLSGLQEPDQFESVQPLGTGLVGMDLGQPSVDGWVGDDQAVDVREPEEPADAVQHGVDRGVTQAAVVQVADVELDVRALNPGQRVKGIGLAR